MHIEDFKEGFMSNVVSFGIPLTLVIIGIIALITALSNLATPYWPVSVVCLVVIIIVCVALKTMNDFYK